MVHVKGTIVTVIISGSNSTSANFLPSNTLKLLQWYLKLDFYNCRQR